MAESGAAITRFDFTSGVARGTHVTLYATCIVHRGEAQLETIPLGSLASVRVHYRRDPRSIGWGIALLVLGLVLFLISDPLAQAAGGAANELSTGSSGVVAALLALLRFVEAAANALPVLGVLALLGAAALAGLGWLGETTLALAFPGGERTYGVRGRSAPLLDFAEAVSEKLMQMSR
jgi:hypothetical protein